MTIFVDIKNIIMVKGMKINLVLISLAVLFCCSLWNDKISFPNDKKKYDVTGKIEDAKQTTDDRGGVTNYLYQRVGKDIKMINVTNNCYYNYKNKIGSNITFSYNTDEWNRTEGNCIILTAILCFWVFFTFLVLVGVFNDNI